MTRPRIVPTDKKCKVCEETKPISEFHAAKLNRDGFHTSCKLCRSAYMAGLYENNSDRIKARVMAAYYENPEIAIARVAAYNAKNPEACAKRKRDWRVGNWDTLRPIYVAYGNAREAHIKQATPPWVDMALILTLYKEAAALTAETGVMHNVDHIIPLRGKNVCGLHVHTNMQVLTEAENKRKHNKFTPESLLHAA